MPCFDLLLSFSSARLGFRKRPRAFFEEPRHREAVFGLTLVVDTGARCETPLSFCFGRRACDTDQGLHYIYKRTRGRGRRVDFNPTRLFCFL